LNSSYSYTDRAISSQNPQFTRDIETQSKGAAVGLTLSFNLFNGFQDKIDLQNARLEEQNKALALKDIQNQIEGLVREKITTFEKQMELVALEMENVTAAEQNLQLQQDRYQIGATSSLEFRDAQVNLTRAQTVLISARYQARITRLEIEQLTGNLELQ
jgi:outer membrane protein TolC